MISLEGITGSTVSAARNVFLMSVISARRQTKAWDTASISTVYVMRRTLNKQRKGNTRTMQKAVSSSPRGALNILARTLSWHTVLVKHAVVPIQSKIRRAGTKSRNYTGTVLVIYSCIRTIQKIGTLS